MNNLAGVAAPLNLPLLPYPVNALEPVISSATVNLHYGKHHRNYVDTANKLIAGTILANLSSYQIMAATAGKAEQRSVFNNVAQAWNHSFYWQSLKPKGGGSPPSALSQKIESAFGSIDACKTELAQNAVAQFGSGWVWLVLDGESLKVVHTGNAETPFLQGQKPLLTIDVWEHAYYLDYQNKRVDYAKAVIDKLLNWEFAAINLEKDPQSL